MNITVNETTSNVGQCTATCLAASNNGTRNLYTFELRYPRIIHGELMTHRVFSRNAMSSRATPAKVLIKEVEDNPYIPTYIIQNKSGMIGGAIVDEQTYSDYLDAYTSSMNSAIEAAKKMDALGVHKNLINRILEPYSFMKTVVTATEWDNFFKLRLAPDAEPNMQDLAKAIKMSMDNAKPEAVEEVDPDKVMVVQHLPYVSKEEAKNLHWLTAMMVSAARCARVSYYNHDGTKPDIDKDLKLFNRLLNCGHMSPMEHPCVSSAYTNANYFNIRGFRSLRYIVEEQLLDDI